LALRELHASCVGEKPEAIGESTACRGGGAERMRAPQGAIWRRKPTFHEEK
jgi:hypothetical protein